MADDIKPAPEAKVDERKAAIAAYYAATDRKTKGEVVKKYPFLADIFSSANHDH